MLLRQAERHSKNQKRHLVFVFPTWNPSLLPPKTKHQNSTPLLRAPLSLVSPWCPSPSLIPIATANEQTHHTPSFLPRNALAHSRVFFSSSSFFAIAVVCFVLPKDHEMQGRKMKSAREMAREEKNHHHHHHQQQQQSSSKGQAWQATD